MNGQVQGADGQMDGRENGSTRGSHKHTQTHSTVLRSYWLCSHPSAMLPFKRPSRLSPLPPQAPRQVPRGRAEVPPKALPPLLQDPRQGQPRGPLQPPAQPAPPDAQPPVGQGCSKYSTQPPRPVSAMTLGGGGDTSSGQCTAHFNSVLGKYPTVFQTSVLLNQRVIHQPLAALGWGRK